MICVGGKVVVDNERSSLSSDDVRYRQIYLQHRHVRCRLHSGPAVGVIRIFFVQLSEKNLLRNPINFISMNHLSQVDLMDTWATEVERLQQGRGLLGQARAGDQVMDTNTNTDTLQ